MSAVHEYCQQDAYSLARLIQARELSPCEALDFALQRMHEVNPQLNAIVCDCSDWARQKLKAMRGDELFYGVPILVKDLGFTMEAIPYTAGSRFFAGSIPSLNSDLIERLLALGMLPFARTNVPELGLSYVTESELFGPCRNPYDLSRTPGGSSGGSAAAVAAGVAPLSAANDGGGSIRIPAACCGLFGFKPTPGLVSLGPWSEDAWSGLAAAHVLTRSVRDSLLLFNFLSAPDLAQAIHNPIDIQAANLLSKPLKVAVLNGAFAELPVEPPLLGAVDQMAGVLKGLGHEVIQHSLSLDLEGIAEATLCLIAANTHAEIESQQLLLQRKATVDELEPITWEFLQRGKTISAAQLIQAKNRLYQLLRPLHALFEEIDLILTPALAQLPLKIGSLRMNDGFEQYLSRNLAFSPFTSLFNQAGLPAMTIAVGYHQHLPLSVQLAAGKNKDWLLMQLAMQLESELADFSKPLMAIKAEPDS